MDLKKIFLVTFSISLVLILASVYLALFYAPLPGMGVKSANEIVASMESSELRVSGFAWNVHHESGPPIMQVIQFLLSDVSDYERYLSAAQSGQVDQDWWTVPPLAVFVRAGGSDGYGQYVDGTLEDGVNVTVNGEVLVAGGAYPRYYSSNYWLLVYGGENVDIVASAAEFSLVTAPIAQKIFYFHMPSAWVSYLGFFVTLVFSAAYLKTRNPKYDMIACSAAELGILFATLALLSGPVWAKQEWGVYWRWNDTKLVTTFVLWLVYIGYLMLRAAITETTTKARVSAVYGILGFITVPMSLLSSRVAPLLQSGHPVVIASRSGSLSPEAGMTIGIAVAAFTFLFITMLIKRVEIAEYEEDLEELKRTVGGEEQ